MKILLPGFTGYKVLVRCNLSLSTQGYVGCMQPGPCRGPLRSGLPGLVETIFPPVILFVP